VTQGAIGQGVNQASSGVGTFSEGQWFPVITSGGVAIAVRGLFAAFDSGRECHNQGCHRVRGNQVSSRRDYLPCFTMVGSAITGGAVGQGVNQVASEGDYLLCFTAVGSAITRGAEDQGVNQRPQGGEPSGIPILCTCIVIPLTLGDNRE